MASTAHGGVRHHSHALRRPRWLLGGVLPVTRSSLAHDVLAGVTLAALGIPEVLGYAKIAGMPVVTGLYTLLAPMAAFALLGSSRHLVVGADSATAAILASSLVGVATRASPRYVALAGLAALLAGGLLLVARVLRLGFLANFLSRTVLVGFLTGVGVQVACGELPEMLGIEPEGHGTIAKLASVIHGIGHVHLPTIAVAGATLAVVLGMRAVTRTLPGALVAVVAAIAASALLHLDARGVALVGDVPGGLPHPTLPTLSLADAKLVLPAAVSMFVVILAQSSATSRAYAARYDEAFDEDVDLVALGAANAAAALIGTFVVNGSPTKTEMVDRAGARSQVAQLTTTAAVVIVLVFLTGPLGRLPTAVLASIVFLIGVELVDVRGLRRVWATRRDELVVAVLTALAVVFVGVEQGIVFAVVASLIDHLRRGYAPPTSVLVPSDEHGWKLVPARDDARTRPGLVVYRFGSSLYYANAHRLFADAVRFASSEPRPSWFCIDLVAVADVDYSAGAMLRRVAHQLARRGTRVVVCSASSEVSRQLAAYGVSRDIGEHAFYDDPHDVVRSFDARDAAHDRAVADARSGRADAVPHGSHPDPAF